MFVSVSVSVSEKPERGTRPSPLPCLVVYVRVCGVGGVSGVGSLGWLGG